MTFEDGIGGYTSDKTKPVFFASPEMKSCMAFCTDPPTTNQWEIEVREDGEVDFQAMFLQWLADRNCETANIRVAPGQYVETSPLIVKFVSAKDIDWDDEGLEAFTVRFICLP